MLITWLALLHADAASGATGHSVPEHLGFETLEQAACGCLEWAWSLNRRREMAGGILHLRNPVQGGQFTCSTLTKGTASRVTYDLKGDWLASFHTHTRGAAHWEGERLSPSDTKIVRIDPLRRPLFVRTPRGRVLKYHQTRTLGISCRRFR